MVDRKDCIDEILDRVGRRVSRAEINDELSQLDAAAQAYSRGPGSKADAYNKARDEQLKRLSEQAMLRRREAHENAYKLINLTRYTDARAKEGISPRLSSEAVMNGVNVQFFKSQDSVATRAETYGNKWIGNAGVEGALERAGLLKLFASRSLESKWGRELWELEQGEGGNPGVTKDANALKIAKILHDFDKMAMTDHNTAGGWIRSMRGHVMKVSWDADKIRKAATPKRFAKGGAEADRIAWVGDVMQHADLGRSFGPLDAKDVLYTMWESMVRGDHFDYASPSDDPIYPNVAAKAAAHREIIWKSFEDQQAINNKYGLYSLTEAKYQGYKTLARQTALIERFGTKPREGFDAWVNHIKNVTTDPNQWQAFDKFAKTGLQYRMGHLDGSMNRPVNRLGSQITGAVMMWNRMSMLKRVLFTHIAGLPTKSSELRFWGAPLADQYRGFITGMERGEEKREFEQLAWTASDANNHYIISHYDNADAPAGLLSRAAESLWRWTGAGALIDRHRVDAQMVMSRRLGMAKGEDFASLGPERTRILQYFGIEEPEWKALNKVEWTQGRGMDGEGVPFLTPQEAMKLSDDDVKAYLDDVRAAGRPVPGQGATGATPQMIAKTRNDLAMSLAVMLQERGNYAMFRPSLKGKMVLPFLRSTQAGTLENNVARLIYQFKLWPVEMFIRTWGREIYGGQGVTGAVSGITQLVVASAIFGTLSEMVRDLAKGQNPLGRMEAHPFKYFMGGLMRSGAATIAGDFLYGEADRHGLTALSDIAGPTFGQIPNVLDLAYGGGPDERHPDRRRAADALRLFKENSGPLTGLWATDLAFEYLVLHKLQEAISPGYVERYERRKKNQEGVDFIVSPTRMVH